MARMIFKRLESQTYRIGDYVAFQTDKREWKMGKPVDWNEPVGVGLVAGTVSWHDTLRDCKSRVQMRRRMARRMEACRANDYRSH